jgi:transcription termination factor Rho
MEYRMHLNDLREKDIEELSKMAEEAEIENAAGMKKHEIIFALLKKHAEQRIHLW